MIIPSIDLMDGQTVQLIGGEEKELEAGDPAPLARKFSVAGEIAVIDLDAAMGKGSNRDLICELLKTYACRVGGGIRDFETAKFWLDAGARRIILGTAAKPELLKQLPRERLIAAIDSKHGEVVVEGWKQGTGLEVIDQIKTLAPYVSGFLVTFVESEGRMKGIDMERVEQVIAAAGDARVTVAGGVTTAEEIAAIDRLGADAQVGMALYKGVLDLGDAIAAPLRTDRDDGLFSTVVVDEQGIALGMVWSDQESIREAVRSGRGVYHSRSRGLWRKGESSGAYQELCRIDLDCDRDAMRFVVKQHGAGFCHLERRDCWGEDHGLGGLSRTLSARRTTAPEGSYTKRLFDDADLLRAKLIEEAGELAEANTADHVAAEAADLFYFGLVAMARAGVSIADVEAVLDRRALKVTRRPGNAKT